MAKRERKILEEGDYDLYIQDVALWTGKFQDRAIAPKVSLSNSPRGKPIVWLYLFDGAARLWATRLAEHCLSADLPWPSFRLYKDVTEVLKTLKRKRVPLRVRIEHRSMNGEAIFLGCVLLRPKS